MDRFRTLTSGLRSKDSKPLLLEYRSASWFIIFSVSTAVFTDIFLYGLVVPVLPFALESRVGIPQEDTQQWISILLAVFAAFLIAFSPISGWLADRTTTRRAPLLISLLFLAGATILLMLGRSVGVLIAGRALQGISGAAVWSIGMALLVDTIGADQMGEAMGYVSLSMALATFCAPLLGGVVYERAGYYPVFYMAYGVIALDIMLRLLLIEKSQAAKWRAPSDCTQENEEGEEKHLHKSPVTTKICTGDINSSPCDEISKDQPASNPGGCGAETRQLQPSSHQETNNPLPLEPEEEPMRSKKRRIPPVLSLLASRRLLAALWGCLVLATVMTSFDAVLPLRVRDIFHWDSLGAGLIFLAVVIPSVLNPLVGKLTDRYGARLPTTVGFLLGTVLLACLRFVDHDSINQKVLLCALLALLGFALSSSVIPLLAEIFYAVDSKTKRNPEAFGKKGAYAQGYGLMNSAWAVGTIVGPLWSGFVNDSAGWGTTTWSLALLNGITAVLMFLLLGGWIGRTGFKAVFRKQDTQKNDKPANDGSLTV